MLIVNENGEDIMVTIRKYVVFIKNVDKNIIYDIKHYDNNNDVMDRQIVKSFIDEFRKLIENIKNGLNILRDMFTDGFNYNLYQVVNY